MGEGDGNVVMEPATEEGQPADESDDGGGDDG